MVRDPVAGTVIRYVESNVVMRRWMRVAVVLAGVFFAGMGVLAQGGFASALTGVTVGSDWFCDASYEGGVCETVIPVGETVRWNVVEGVHTVTECDSAFVACPPPGGFESGVIFNGGTFEHTFTEPDVVEYFCAIHPQTMRGRVVVLAPTPAPTAVPTAVPEPGMTPAPTVAVAGAVSAGGVSAAPADLPQSGGPPPGGGADTLPLVAGLLMLALAAGTVAAASRSAR
jgi:hypothetical protein